MQQAACPSRCRLPARHTIFLHRLAPKNCILKRPKMPSIRRAVIQFVLVSKIFTFIAAQEPGKNLFVFPLLNHLLLLFARNRNFSKTCELFSQWCS